MYLPRDVSIDDSKRHLGQYTVTMITLEAIKRSELLLAPPKYSFKSHTKQIQGKAFNMIPAKGTDETPLNTTSAMKGIGMATVIERRAKAGGRTYIDRSLHSIPPKVP